MHELLKYLDRLAVVVPVYWVFLPSVLSGASAILSGIRHALQINTSSFLLLRFANDAVPAFIVTCACGQIMLKVS